MTTYSLDVFLSQFWTSSCFTCSSDGKESSCNAEDPGSISGLRRSPRKGNGNPIQYSFFFFFTPVFFPGECYGQRSLAGYSPGVAKSWTQLRNKHYYCSTSDSNCCFLTCIQVSQGAGKVVWYFHHFENFPQFVVIHIVKGFRVVNEAGVDVSSGILLLFLWCSRCWQFNLWFLWLFKIQLANLEILCSYTVEP